MLKRVYNRYLSSDDPYHTDLYGLAFSVAILLLWAIGICLAFEWRFPFEATQ